MKRDSPSFRTNTLRWSMIAKVIDWTSLLRPMIRLQRHNNDAFDLIRARFFVMKEIGSIPGLGLTPLDLTLDLDTIKTLLGVPVSSQVPEPGLYALAGTPAGVFAQPEFHQIRQELASQLAPWQAFFREFNLEMAYATSRILLGKQGAAPARRLLQELQILRSAPAIGDAALSPASLPVLKGPGYGADTVVEKAFSLSLATRKLLKKSSLDQLVFGKSTLVQKLRPQDKRRLVDHGLPVLDSLLRSLLRSVSRHVTEGDQLDARSNREASATARLDRLVPLLAIRSQLFMQAGDYERAFLFLIAATAWQEEDQGAGSTLQAGIAAQLSGRYSEAEALYRTAMLFGTADSVLLHNFGHVLLALDREDEARRYLEWSAALSYGYYMAHQNLAGMYETQTFVPRAFDRAGYPQVLLYDAYNLQGERLVHIGEGERGVRFYGAALHKQEELARTQRLPDEIRKILNDEYGIAPDEPVRILPYEWVTLIGHIAMLDSYLKLKKLGMSKPPGRPLLLAPAHKVANWTFLDLWRPHITIIDNPYLVQDLFAYQRCFGDCFNGYVRDDGSAGDWTELGALGQVAWDAGGQGPLIRISDYLWKEGANSLRQMGLGSSDWFVTLHIRDTGFHSEGKHSMQMHRNAQIEDYLPAIRAITGRGGWVIRMGDSRMERMPPMDRVIDYPHTRFKSEQCDIFLASAARFFLGTTSGLTNVVISLGTPCLLVNCISNYYQLWNNRVLFTVKPLWDRTKQRFLTLAEMTSDEFRWNIFNTNRLQSIGIEPQANSAEEIEAATIEMLERVYPGKPLATTDADIRLQELYASRGNRCFFGNGRLSQSFYASREEDLFGPRALESTDASGSKARCEA